MSGQINVINDTNSTSYTTGSLVTAGGIGIAKDVFINGTLNTTKMYLMDPSGITLGSQYFSNGTIWNIENQVGTGSTKSLDISQTGVAINQITSATSTTTGALTVVGGISTQDSVWAKGKIVATDASSSTITITPETPSGADSSIKNGVIMNNSGIVNDVSENLILGINTKHFGTRTSSNQGGVMKISTSSSSPLFDFSVLSAGSTGSADPTSALTIDQNGIVKVQTSTQSTTTTSGALKVVGGVGVAKNINVGGVISVWDGMNSGTISQSGTNLNITATNINLTGNISLTGNIQINGNVTLNGEVTGGSDTTITSTALDYKVLDDCILHTHVYNMANPSTPKTMLTSSYPLKDYSNNTAISLTQNTLYFYAVRLIQGQTVKGVFFWSNSTNTNIRTGLYSPDGTLKVSLNTNQSITGNNMKYLPLTNSTWTVDSTNIYYVGILSTSSSTTIYGTAINNYINYGVTGTVTGKLSLVASTTGVTIINSNFLSPQQSNNSNITYGTTTIPSTSVTGWLFYAGFIVNNSTLIPTPYPVGSQAAGIQYNRKIEQENIYLTPNNVYILSLYAVARSGYNINPLRINLTSGTTQTIATVTPTYSWDLYSYTFTISQANLYTLSINGTFTDDRITVFQGINISSTSSALGELPSSLSVTSIPLSQIAYVGVYKDGV